MNRLLFNLYYSSNHSYKSNSNYIFFFFQLLNNFHIFIILDIIFNKSSITWKTISFPFYYFFPYQIITFVILILIYYIGGVFLFIFCLFLIVLFIPSTSNKYLISISKVINRVIEIFFSSLLHILFYLSTKKFIIHSNVLNKDIDAYTGVWIFFTFY